MTSRNYSANALPAALTAGVNDTTTTIPVSLTTGWPAAPFLVALDYGAATQEVVLVTVVSGLNLTVTRGYDSTTAQAHALSGVVKCVHSAVDFRDSRTHEAATSAVHGATGTVVGTTDTQALTNKDLSSGTNTFPTTLVTTAGVQAVTHKDLTDATNSFPAALATDAEVATAVSNHAALTQTHGVAVALVGTTDTQTLTNKTLTSPTINTPTITSPTFSGDYVGAPPRYLNKSVDENVASSTAFQDDDTLTFTVVAGATYIVRQYVSTTTGVPDTNGGFKAQITMPAGAVYISGVTESSGPVALGGIAANAHVNISTYVADFRVKTSATAGSVTLQWAQVTSNVANATTQADSYWLVTRIA